MEDYDRLSREMVFSIPDGECPMVVLSDCMTSFVSRRIIFWSNIRNKHEKYRYSHAMLLVAQGLLASQDAVFRMVPLDKYMTGDYRLKFFYHEAWSPLDRRMLAQHIVKGVNEPWHRRVYDAPGIIGQWLHSTLGWGRWINMPGIHFCSPRTLSFVQFWAPELSLQSSPAEMDEYFSGSPYWKCFGVYDPTNEKENTK